MRDQVTLNGSLDSSSLLKRVRVMARRKGGKAARRKRPEPSKSKRYENLAQTIISQLRDQRKDSSIKVSRSRVAGASGYHHQIDVSVCATNDLTLLECKCWNKKIDPEAVLCLAARVRDIQAGKKPTPVKVTGAIVTKIGLGEGAGTVARYLDVCVYTVRNQHDFGVRLLGDIYRRVP